MGAMVATGEFTHSLLPSLVYYSGIWSIWGLLACLAITPMSQTLRWRELVYVRRMLGLSGLAYALVHVVVYVFLRKFDWLMMGRDMFGRWSLIWAILSTVGLCMLGATSTDGALKAMGGRGWKRLQRWVYWLVPLGVLHFLLSPLAVGPLPFFMSGVLLWLLAWRWWGRSRGSLAPKGLALLTLASAACTLVFELVWLKVYQDLSPAMIAWSNLELDMGLSAAWSVFLSGGTFTGVVVWIRQRERASSG
jgi:sulfoxide reductase heme-binding subunit YedZ